MMNLVGLTPSQIGHVPPAYGMTHLLDHLEILQAVFDGLTTSIELQTVTACELSSDNEMLSCTQSMYTNC